VLLRLLLDGVAPVTGEGSASTVAACDGPNNLDGPRLVRVEPKVVDALQLPRQLVPRSLSRYRVDGLGFKVDGALVARMHTKRS